MMPKPARKMAFDSEILPPPENDVTFECLCRDLWAEIWGDPNAQRNGRNGQKQDGADIFGQVRGKWMAVQCKQKSNLLGTKLTVSELEAEVSKAKLFIPKLTSLIVATTGPQVAQVQKRAREITSDHKSTGQFDVTVFSWPDIWRELSNRPALFNSAIRNYWPRMYQAARDATKSIREARELPAKGPSVDVSRLPPTDFSLFGRRHFLTTLSNAWWEDGPRIVSLIAVGGTGKTALVNTWLQSLLVKLREQLNEKTYIFGYSFFSQGATASPDVSSASFFKEIFKFLGLRTPERKSPVEKARILADRIRGLRLLLVLDGVEPLQLAPRLKETDGRLRDAGLSTFLRSWNPEQSLCVITSRLPVADLRSLHPSTHLEIELPALDPPDGSQLLRFYLESASPSKQQKQSVALAPNKELEHASRDFGGHPLALKLLATYISVAHNGDIRRRKEIGPLTEAPGANSHATRIIQQYAKWFKNRAETKALYMLSLFDRPVDDGALRAIRRQPEIGGLTDGITEVLRPVGALRQNKPRLHSLTESAWTSVLTNLQRMGLASVSDGLTDCHPLVREFFSSRLKRYAPAAWKEGNKRLFEHFKDLPPDYLPQNQENAELLFRSVHHGCRAGLYERALHEVYKPRLRRGTQSWCIHSLGAVDSDASAMFGFFAGSWEKPVDELADTDAAFVLSGAGFDLRALGRLHEAIQVSSAALSVNEKAKDLAGIAIALRNNAQLLLLTGRLREALQSAKRAVAAADDAEDDHERMVERVTLGYVLHQMGRLAEAEKEFVESERIQRDKIGTPAHHYSIGAYRFSELLIDLGRIAEAHQRNQQALKVERAEENRSALDRGLNKINFGRTLYVMQPGMKHRVARLLADGLSDLIASRRMDYLPIAHLALAEFFRQLQSFDSAQRELSAAFDIIQRSGLKLFHADWHREAAALKRSAKKRRFPISTLDRDQVGLTAEQHMQLCADLVKATGYGRLQSMIDKF